MTAQPIAIQKISQVSIPVRQVEAALRFYQGVLGLNLLYKEEKLALLLCNGVRIFLSVPESSAFDQRSSVFYFLVEDIDSSFASLVSQDVTVLGKPHKIAELGGTEFWMAFFKDPDGNVHALTAEKKIG